MTDRHGRTWTVSRMRWEESEEEDFRFWYEELTPEQRVAAVDEATASCLKARGIDTVPRLKKVARRIKCPWYRASHRKRPQDRA